MAGDDAVDARGAECARAAASGSVAAGVVTVTAAPLASIQRGEVAPLDAQGVDEDALAADFERGGPGGAVGERHYSGTARASATPSMAAAMATSQTRVTTCVSAQPISSRCWWKGARLNSRLPPVKRK